MSCRIADKAVCLGSTDHGGSCLLCVRKSARDAFLRGEMTLEQFAAVMDETSHA